MHSICSTNNFVFSELIQINPFYADKIDTFRGLFTGKPETILINVEGEVDGNQPVDPPADQDPNAQ